MSFRSVGTTGARSSDHNSRTLHACDRPLRALTRHHRAGLNRATDHHMRRHGVELSNHVVTNINEGQEAGTHWREREQR